MIVRIDNNVCIRCGKCFEICPVEAVKKTNDLYSIDNSVCINCLACERECPAQAVIWEQSDASDLNDKLDKFTQENVTEKSNLDNDCCSNKSACVIDEILNSLTKEEKKELKKTLRFIVEDTIAPKIEKLFLLFLDGIERITTCNKK